jgi:hypothetical protein
MPFLSPPTLTQAEQRALLHATAGHPRSSRPGRLPDRAPLQIRTWRLPPSGSSVAVTHGRAPQSWTEPLRVCRRLHSLRGWGHGTIQQILT